MAEPVVDIPLSVYNRMAAVTRQVESTPTTQVRDRRRNQGYQYGRVVWVKLLGDASALPAGQWPREYIWVEQVMTAASPYFAQRQNPRSSTQLGNLINMVELTPGFGTTAGPRGAPLATGVVGFHRLHEHAQIVVPMYLLPASDNGKMVPRCFVDNEPIIECPPGAP